MKTLDGIEINDGRCRGHQRFQKEMINDKNTRINQ